MHVSLPRGADGGYAAGQRGKARGANTLNNQPGSQDDGTAGCLHDGANPPRPTPLGTSRPHPEPHAYKGPS